MLLGIDGDDLWPDSAHSRVYVVNLIPTVAAVGTPNAPTAPPAPLPGRRARSAGRALRSPTPTPSLAGARAREPVTLPAPARLPRLPPPSPGAARRGREGAALAREPDQRRPAAEPPRTATKAGGRVARRPPAPRGLRPDRRPAWARSRWTLGLPVRVVPPPGAAEGRGRLAAAGTDGPSPSQKPLIWSRSSVTGRSDSPRIEKSSGNAFYDQAALRAIPTPALSPLAPGLEPALASRDVPL